MWDSYPLYVQVLEYNLNIDGNFTCQNVIQYFKRSYIFVVLPIYKKEEATWIHALSRRLKIWIMGKKGVSRSEKIHTFLFFTAGKSSLLPSRFHRDVQIIAYLGVCVRNRNYTLLWNFLSSVKNCMGWVFFFPLSW